MITLMIIIFICLGILGGLAFYISHQNDILRQEIERLENKVHILTIKNRELTKNSIYKYRYEEIINELDNLKKYSLSKKLTGVEFCKLVAKMIKKYCK